MNPFFFGTSEKQLFGVYHPPELREVSNAAVVLCPAFGHEYIAAHNSIHSLAAQLSRAGFHTLFARLFADVIEHAVHRVVLGPAHGHIRFAHPG